LFRKRNLLFVPVYFILTTVAMLRLLVSNGIPQGDWGIPLTEAAAMKAFYSGFYIWNIGGFGGPGSGFYYFNFLYPLLSPLGFYGSGEVKALAFGFMFFSGIGMYLLIRSFGLRRVSSFISGVVYMISPIMFDHLVYGWITYLFSYTMLPFFLFLMKRQVDGKGMHNALLAGALEAVALDMPSSIAIYFLLPVIFTVIEGWRDRRKLISGLAFVLVSTAVALLSVIYYFFPQSFSGFLTAHEVTAGLDSVIAQYHQLSSLPVTMRFGGTFVTKIYTSYFPGAIPIYLLLILIPVAIALYRKKREIYFFLAGYLFVFAAYFVYINLAYIVHNVPYGVIFEGLSPLMFPAVLGFAALIGYAVDWGVGRKSHWKYAMVIGIAFLVFFSGTPWWTGQISGPQEGGLPSRLTLYLVPESYFNWQNGLPSGLVLYYPGGGYALMSYLNVTHPINGAIFYGMNTMPSVSPDIASVVDFLILSGSNATVILGEMGIRYFAVYTNVFSVYNTSKLLEILQSSRGINLAYDSQYVKAFMVENTSPIIAGNATIISSSPVSYTVTASGNSITLIQAYNGGWVAYSGGQELKHESVEIEGFAVNRWLLDGPGIVKIYYAPQTQYIEYLAASLATFFGAIALYIVFELFRRRNQILYGFL
jgi:hypothetical protein